MPKTRNRTPKPPIESRQWLTATEVGHLIGASRATVHRMANGEVPGCPRLPFMPRGMKARVFMKPTVERWIEDCQKGTAT
jgi:predicted DNA-binding transcriptional regulator AlpA